MARVIGGVNGVVSGKVGNVVFYSSNGGNYVRSLPTKRRSYTPSAKQVAQRTRFIMVQDWLRPILPLIRVGFNDYAPRQSSHNSAMSYNMHHALIENDGAFEIDPEKFAFSVGLLPGLEHASIKQIGNYVEFRWELIDNLPVDNRLDRTMLLLYRPGSDFSNFKMYGNDRWQKFDSLSLEGYKPGDVCYGYMAFISSANQQVSNSIYIGKLEIDEF